MGQNPPKFVEQKKPLLSVLSGSFFLLFPMRLGFNFSDVCLTSRGGGKADAERGIFDFKVEARMKVARYVDIKKHLFKQYLL